ncbi:MAG: hypothetical protein HOA58_10240 [Rhodospirillaceae bacterium]|nr:hypothetical protein [Rhodospirillaceae bacterium]MBT6829887.1 hypothetical protein [Rhodospirillaceae bacterium]MBT7293833.1 hypothetical protein [Rhodospirillaceae bacterium]
MTSLEASGIGRDSTSMWFVVWGERTFHMIYPQGTSAGLQRDNKGKQTKESSGLVFDVYRDKFTWDVGMSVRDWRYISRIANIDVSDLNATATSASADLHDLMVTAYYKLHQRKIPHCTRRQTCPPRHSPPPPAPQRGRPPRLAVRRQR